MVLIEHLVNKERNEAVKSDYKNGMAIIDMVAKYRISSTRIYKILEKLPKRGKEYAKENS